MRLKFVLLAFALLLAISSATSFVGYKYLGLASDYRERNFLHLNATYNLIELLQAAPVMRPDELNTGREHLDVIYIQATWCRGVLSSFEQWMFQKIGVNGALDVCARDLVNAAQANRILESMDAAFRDTGAPHDRAFALNLETREVAERIRMDSLAFHPFVSIIEDRITVAVRLGTALTAFGLTVAFFLIARDLLRSHKIQAVQTKALKHQTQELAKLAAIAERAEDSMLLTDETGRVTWCNPAFEELTGYALVETKGRKPSEFLQGPDTDPETICAIHDALKDCRPIKCKILNYRKDGSSYWLSLSISALETDEGEHYGFVAISSDISREMHQRAAIDAANREIEHRSLHDPLTELPNRRALDDAMRTRLNDRCDTTLLRIDLDHFKYVNDTIGHDAGDFVLEHVAKIIRDEVHDSDLPARVGGDEFVILLSEGRTSEDGVAVANRLLERIKAPIPFETKVIRIGVSFGVASTLDGLLCVDRLIVGADAALYTAKENGRNCTHVYTPALHAEIEDRRKMARELKRAVAGDEFIAHYQPQIDAKTREVVGVEALVRWQSSALGLLLPDQFLPVARRLSIVEEIDDCVFRKAIGEISGLRSAGIAIGKLALNVTARRISDPSVVQMIRETGTGAVKIAFEVLESVLVENQNAQFQFGLDALREAGVAIEVDDFGSGHASIVGLMQLQPDAMKIERRLVQSIDGNDVSRIVVENIVNIGKSMNLSVIAEGVETLEQADVLTELGCDVLQGFAFAKPMPLQNLKAYLRTHSADDVA
ncbi:MAG: EAL domain-containing protein [Pseudomonadota bacterium]